MKKTIILMVVVALAMSLAVGPIYANESVSSEVQSSWQGKKAGNWMVRVSDILQMKVEELREQLRDGKTIVEVAEEKGISSEDLTKSVVEDQNAHISERFEQGMISEEKINQCLAQVEQRITERLNRVHMFRQRAADGSRPLQKRGNF
ncbi:hypothetical protein [Candidatus Contubernalis alkaliaceticus]|uniref:hypothetical protein n=1 Tax=Candidatus Contubernalis alkaliaceticus TaxID=338645 RepID=UPI001F4C2111|nr:hypothetical protein [Candidatus Contubernalis alkalaceticus]UNC92674.1 hypothetical protein HUE98_11545 [Candidatus Contubernalis alkalaceticus]